LKLTGYGARLALAGQLARDPNARVVTGGVMEEACKLARWFGNEAARIYNELAETQEQREARELCEFIERRGGAVTVRDVITYYRPLRNERDKAEQQLSALCKGGLGKWEPIPTTLKGGKPTRKFQLLPVSASAKPIRLTRENAEVMQLQTATVTGENEGSGATAGASAKPDQEVEQSEKSPPGTASVPVMITKQMESDLRAMGYSQADIDKMTPRQANEILARKPPPADKTDTTDSGGSVSGQKGVSEDFEAAKVAVSSASEKEVVHAEGDAVPEEKMRL